MTDFRLLPFGLGCLLSLPIAVACGDDSEQKEDEACTPGDLDSCDEGLVCETVAGGEPACFAPVFVRGRVVDLASSNGIEGAELVALDVNGSARSGVAVSGEDGEYELPIALERDADGNPVQDDSVTLFVVAAGYQTFPTPPREALPIDLGEPVEELDEDDEVQAWVVMNAATDVGLIALPGDLSQAATIRGRVDHELGPSTLVVAVQGGEAVSTAVADLEGSFALFNVPAGETSVEGYRAGLHVTPAIVTPEAADEIDEVVLEADTDQLTTVSGQVSLVNAEGGLTTSVILVLESTFIQSEAIARGIAPPGLRAGDVSGAFEIAGVPPGEYAVLAAFENDLLVRDPDEGISGTDVVHIVVTGTEPTHDLAEGFKVTGALAVESPGADGLTILDSGASPTFVWADDSSEDGYELRVFDSFGMLVHEALDVARVTGNATVSYTWTGANLEAGAIYQFRVLSYRNATGGGGMGMGMGGDRTYISATEDLRGVFQIGATAP
jgi:hypothetical protein